MDTDTPPHLRPVSTSRCAATIASRRRRRSRTGAIWPKSRIPLIRSRWSRELPPEAPITAPLPPRSRVQNADASSASPCETKTWTPRRQHAFASDERDAPNRVEDNVTDRILSGEIVAGIRTSPGVTLLACPRTGTPAFLGTRRATSWTLRTSGEPKWRYVTACVVSPFGRAGCTCEVGEWRPRCQGAARATNGLPAAGAAPGTAVGPAGAGHAAAAIGGASAGVSLDRQGLGFGFAGHRSRHSLGVAPCPAGHALPRLGPARGA